MNVKDLASTSPIIGSLPSFTPRQGLEKSSQLQNPSSLRADKTQDIFTPTKSNDLLNTMSPPRRRNTTMESMPLVRQPRVESSSPRSSINFSNTRSSPKSVKKFSKDSNINTNEIANFNKELKNNLDIFRLKDLYDKEEIPFVDLDYLADNDYICRVNSKGKVPSRDPSLNILLKHNLPRVSLDRREQMKFFVQVIYEAVSNTREENLYDTSSSNNGNDNEEDDDLDLSNINLPQLRCEMDIWLSSLNECVKAIGTKIKPVALIILVIQRELKRNFKQLLSLIDNEQSTPSQNANTLSKPSKLGKTTKSQLEADLSDPKAALNATVEKAKIVGALKRDIQKLEDRITQYKCDLIAAQIEVKDRDKQCERLLDVNHHLRETITNQERKLAAMSDKSGEISASGLGQVPDAAQVVWGELSSFARDMTKALKKVNMDLLLPESTAQLNQPKVGLNAPSTAANTFKAKAARRKSYASTVQNNLLFDFDIYSLANAVVQPAGKDSAKIQTSSSGPASMAPPQKPTMVPPTKASVGLNVGDSFPKANTMVPPSDGGGDAFPKASATVAFPPANSGVGDAFPKANTMVQPSGSGGGDAFPRASTMVPPQGSGGDAFPKANTGGGDAFPRANTMVPPQGSAGGDAFPRASTMVPPSGGGGGDAFPRASTMVPPQGSAGGDAFPRASTMVPPQGGGGDAFPRAKPAVAFPPANSGGGGDAFPRATVSFPPSPSGGNDAFPKANAGGGDAFPRAKPAVAFPPASTADGGDSFSRLGNSPAGPGHFPSLMSNQPAAPMSENINKSASAPIQKRVRAPTRPNKKLHFTNFFPDLCNFTDTCSGGLLKKPPSSIYTQLESELRQFLVQVFQKYKDRMGGVRTEVEKMSDKFNNQLAHIKEGLGTRSLWARVLFKADDYIVLPKDVKVPEEYQEVTFSEIARAIVAKMNPQESEEFIRIMRPNSDSNQTLSLNAPSDKAGPKQNETMNVRPTTASDVLFDVFPANLIEKMIDFIAYVNKTAKTDISVDMFRRFFSADLPFTHFIFFCKFYLFSLSLTAPDIEPQQQRINALSLIFNRYGYNTTFPAETRSALEEQYCASLPSFLVLAMSLYTHIISKLSQKVENEMNSQKTASPSSKKGGGGVNFRAHGTLGKQQFLLNYLKESVINYVEPEKPKPKTEEEDEEDDEEERKRKKEEEKKRKEEQEKARQKMMMSPEKEAENKNAVEYMKAIAGSAKDLSFIEVAVEMFNYIIPLEDSLVDFDPQNEELLVYLSTFGVKPKKGKKAKDKVKRSIEPIKPGDLLTK